MLVCIFWASCLTRRLTAPERWMLRNNSNTRRNSGVEGVAPAKSVSWFFNPFREAAAAISTLSAGQPDWIMKKTDSGGTSVINALTNWFPVSGT
jgi:hypothetical protein